MNNQTPLTKRQNKRKGLPFGKREKQEEFNFQHVEFEGHFKKNQGSEFRLEIKMEFLVGN